LPVSSQISYNFWDELPCVIPEETTQKHPKQSVSGAFLNTKRYTNLATASPLLPGKKSTGGISIMV